MTIEGYFLSKFLKNICFGYSLESFLMNTHNIRFYGEISKINYYQTPSSVFLLKQYRPWIKSSLIWFYTICPDQSVYLGSLCYA